MHTCSHPFLSPGNPTSATRAHGKGPYGLNAPQPPLNPIAPRCTVRTTSTVHAHGKGPYTHGPHAHGQWQWQGPIRTAAPLTPIAPRCTVAARLTWAAGNCRMPRFPHGVLCAKPPRAIHSIPAALSPQCNSTQEQPAHITPSTTHGGHTPLGVGVPQSGPPPLHTHGHTHTRTRTPCRPPVCTDMYR